MLVSMTLMQCVVCVSDCIYSDTATVQNKHNKLLLQNNDVVCVSNVM